MFNLFGDGVMDYDKMRKTRNGTRFRLKGELVEKVQNMKTHDGVEFVRLKKVAGGAIVDFGTGTTWDKGTWKEV